MSLRLGTMYVTLSVYTYIDCIPGSETPGHRLISAMKKYLNPNIRVGNKENICFGIAILF